MTASRFIVFMSCDEADQAFFVGAFTFFRIFIGIRLIYNVVLVSGVLTSDSVIDIHIFILFQILFLYRVL